MIYKYQFFVKLYYCVQLTHFVLNEQAIFDQAKNIRIKSIDCCLKIKQNFVKT